MVREVFPFLHTLGGEGSTYSDHMKDARYTIPTAALLSKVVDLIDDIPMDNRDTNGDLYEYLLSKIASAGTNGQFRTPRHIIELMVAMTAPTPEDEICDPACGTAGFLAAASEYVREHHPSALTNVTQRQHFHNSMFHGYDFDSTMLRIGSMNMLMHGIEAPDIRYRDSLSEGASSEEEQYSLILANPPFAGSLDYEATAKDLQRVVKTKKTELLFLALFLKLLRPGGRAAVIVPEGVLFGSSKAHKTLRKILVEEQKLDAVVKLPSGVFKPTPVSRRRSSSSRGRTPAAPMTCGSTTCGPTASRSTTSATRSTRTTSPTFSPAGRPSPPRWLRSEEQASKPGPSLAAPAPTSRSPCRRKTSSPRTMTFR